MYAVVHIVGTQQMSTGRARGPLSANMRLLCGCGMFQTWAWPPPSQACPVRGDFGQGMWVLGPLLPFQWIQDSYEEVEIPHSESQG